MRKFFGPVGLLVFATGVMACSKDPQAELRQHMEQGDRYTDKKAYAEAILEYRIAVTADPNSGQARFKLAKAHESSGDLQNAYREYVRAADLLPNDPDAQLSAGRMLIGAKQYPEARQRAEAVLARNPKNAEALALLGNALAGLKDLDAAITQLEEAVDADPHRVLSYANLGALQAFKGDQTAAEKAFRRAVEIEPESVSAHLSLANYLWAAAKQPEAIAEFDRALKIEPNSPKALQGLAALYISLGNRDQAEAYLRRLAGAVPEWNPKVLLIDYLIVGGKVDAARELLTTLLHSSQPGVEPSNSATVRLAALDHAVGHKAEAYAGLNALLKRQPLDEAAVLVKTRLLLRDGRQDEAVHVIAPLAESRPDSVSAQFTKAQALEATRDVSRAIEAYQQALRLSPTLTPAMLKLANLLSAEGNSGAAIDMATQAIKITPESIQAHFELAKALILRGSYNEAQTELKGLVLSAPSVAEVHVMQGRLSWLTGDGKRAQLEYDKALELKPNSIEALAGAVEADIFFKNPRAARDRIQKALTAGPRSSELLELAGRTLFVTGDAKPGQAALVEAIKLDPTNHEAYVHLTASYASEGRLDDALKLFESAQQFPAVGSLTMQGIILSIQGKAQEAQKRYERAIAIDPNAAVAANNLAYLYAESGQNLEVAQQLAQTAKTKLPQDPEVSDTLGWVYYRKGLADLAITAFKEGLSRDKSNPVMHYHLGLAYAKNGDKAEATRALEQALKLSPSFQGAEDAKRVLSSLKG